MDSETTNFSEIRETWFRVGKKNSTEMIFYSQFYASLNSCNNQKRTEAGENEGIALPRKG